MTRCIQSTVYFIIYCKSCVNRILVFIWYRFTICLDIIFIILKQRYEMAASRNGKYIYYRIYAHIFQRVRRIVDFSTKLHVNRTVKLIIISLYCVLFELSIIKLLNHLNIICFAIESKHCCVRCMYRNRLLHMIASTTILVQIFNM